MIKRIFGTYFYFVGSIYEESPIVFLGISEYRKTLMRNEIMNLSWNWSSGCRERR